MKYLFPLLLSLLLMGCSSSQTLPPEATEPVPAVTAPAQPLPITELTTPAVSSGPLQVYPLEQEVSGILPLGDDLLLFSGTESSTTLMLLDPQTLQTIRTYDTGIVLTAQNFTVQQSDSGISYFDHRSAETVVLDPTLREIQRIPAPEGSTGASLLSSDHRSLYYCTSTAIRVLDLDSGISRVLKESAYPTQGLTGLLLNDQVLQVSITELGGSWQTLFLSTENGQLVAQHNDQITPAASGDQYYLDARLDGIDTILFGTVGKSTMTFQPLRHGSSCLYLPRSHRLLSTGVDGNSTYLEVYDLKSGRRTAELTLSGTDIPQTAAETADGSLWFLRDSGDSLFRWDPSGSEVEDDTVYTGVYYTRENPDYDGLAICALYAQEIGSRYGIDILIYREAVLVQPWDYDFEYEYQASVLARELELLDQRLGSYPEEMLQQLSDTFTSLKICLVRSAAGSPESGSLTDVNGIQFWNENDAYIVLATDHDTQYALHHELYHLIDTVVLNASVALDRWDALNPEDFRYDNDYVSNQVRDGSPWLETGREYFIDTYSMSWPKEDRARIMEYAMTSGHEDLFRSPRLQAKLKQLCIGIREAFRLEKCQEIFPWEQYLEEPVAYTP